MKTNKENVIDVAAKIFLSKGFEGSTTREIAKEAGLANASCLFNYFRGKEEIYQAVMEKYLLRTHTPKQKFGDCSNLSLKDFIDLYIDKVEKTMFFLKNKLGSEDINANRYYTFILECGHKNSEYARVALLSNNEEIELWQAAIEKAKEAGEVSSHVNSFDTAKLFRYAYMGISFVFSMEGGVKIEQVRELMYNIYNNIKNGS